MEGTENQGARRARGALMGMRQVAYAILLCLLGAAAAEVASRADDRVRLGVSLAATPDYERDLIVHDAFGIRGRPDGRFRHWKLNQYGFRSPGMAMHTTAGCIRVMMLGASETFGLYEPDGREYPAQLQTILNRDGCHEVINAGIAGLTLRGIITLWEQWGSRFEPDIVVIYPTPAFYLAPHPPSNPALPVARADGQRWSSRFLQHVRDRFEIPAFIQRRRVTWAMRRFDEAQPAGWFFTNVPDERLQRFAHDLDELVVAIDRVGARPVLVTHAVGFGVPVPEGQLDELLAWRQLVPKAAGDVLPRFDRAAAAATRELAERRRITLVDAAREMDGRDEWFAEDLVHFSEAGARTVASLIADRIAPPHGGRDGAALTATGRTDVGPSSLLHESQVGRR